MMGEMRPELRFAGYEDEWIQKTFGDAFNFYLTIRCHVIT